MLALAVMTLTLAACSQTQATQPTKQVPPGYHMMSNGQMMKNGAMNMQ